jgi:hypothetical protein
MITYVIPSYDRARTLQKKSLKMLRENGVSNDDIVIVVANDEQAQHYNNILSGKYNIITSQLGIVQVRNHIRRLYHNQKIVMLDDDISGMFLKQAVKDKANEQFLKIYNLPDYVKLGFKTLEKNNARLFGFGSSLNPINIRHSVKSGLVLVAGIYLEICDGDIQIDEKYGVIDDLEISMKYYLKYGRNYRFNIVAHNAGRNARLEPGGLQSVMSPAQRDIEELELRKDFCNRYESFISSSKVKNHKLRIYWKRLYSGFNEISDFNKKKESISPTVF